MPSEKYERYSGNGTENHGPCEKCGALKSKVTCSFGNYGDMVCENGHHWVAKLKKEGLSSLRGKDARIKTVSKGFDSLGRQYLP